MRLFDSLRPAPVAKRAIDSSSIFQSTYTGNNNERIQQTWQSYVLDGYQANAIVFACVLARASLFGEASFKFRDLTTKKLFGTSDLAILENPWPNGTTGELLWRMEQDVSLAGNFFAARVNNRIERLRPDYVEIVSEHRVDDATGNIYRDVIGYVYRPFGPLDTTEQFYPVESVVHWSPIPDPLASFRGMSWLTPVVREINSDLSMTTHKSKFFENAATPNLILKYQNALQADTVKAISERFDTRYGGADQAWRTVVLDGGADLTVVGNSFQEMAFTDVQAAGENRIAAAAGVPSIVAGFKEGLQAATYSNYGQAMRRFADITMRPNWRSASAALAKFVNVPQGAELWYDVSDIAALREGEKDRADSMHTLAVAAGELIRAGYKPDTVAEAVISGDFSLLSHTGAIPTALYPAGKEPGPSEVMKPGA